MQQHYGEFLADTDSHAFVQAQYTISCDSLVKKKGYYVDDGHQKTATVEYQNNFIDHYLTYMRRGHFDGLKSHLLKVATLNTSYSFQKTVDTNTLLKMAK